jgi:two-component system cell cycle response regulator
MKILVGDNSKLTRTIIREELQKGGFEIVEAENADQVFQTINNTEIDLVTLGVEMSGQSGYEICAKINQYILSEKNPKKLPIIFITGNDTLEGRNLGFAAGATDFITKPFQKGQILELINKLLSPDEGLKGSVALIIDDSKLDRKIISDCLEETGVGTIAAADGLEGYNILKENADSINMVISDFIMPHMMGNEFCQKVRKELKLVELPIIILSGLHESMSVLDIFRSGATDYVNKPFIKEEFLARLTVHLKSVQLNRELKIKINELKDLNLTLKRMAMTDHLTKLANRRYFFHRFKNSHSALEKSGENISFIIMDIDNFKKVNDQYGHQVGDIVLKRVAKLIYQSTRGNNLVGRLGGEEFGILVPLLDDGQMKALAETVRKNIAEYDFSRENKTGLKNITVSIGVYTTMPSYKESVDVIYLKADENLYIAKNKGKNIVIAS